MYVDCTFVLISHKLQLIEYYNIWLLN